MTKFFFKFDSATTFSLSATNLFAMRHIIIVIIVFVILQVGLIVCFSLIIVGIIPVLKENIEAVVGCDVDEEIEVIDNMIRKSQIDLLDAGKDEARVQEIGERIVSLRERRQDVLTQAAVRKDEIDRIKAMIAFIEEQTGEAEYSEALVRSMIGKVTIHDDRITVEFKSGLAIDVDA